MWRPPPRSPDGGSQSHNILPCRRPPRHAKYRQIQKYRFLVSVPSPVSRRAGGSWSPPPGPGPAWAGSSRAGPRLLFGPPGRSDWVRISRPDFTPGQLRPKRSQGAAGPPNGSVHGLTGLDPWPPAEVVHPCSAASIASTPPTSAAWPGRPRERVRLHTCYGINEGPRVHDAPLADLIETRPRGPGERGGQPGLRVLLPGQLHPGDPPADRVGQVRGPGRGGAPGHGPALVTRPAAPGPRRGRSQRAGPFWRNGPARTLYPDLVESRCVTCPSADPGSYARDAWSSP
jgi:hypothetical protein